MRCGGNFSIQWILGCVAFMAGAASAGRPLAIDDADPVEPTHFEFEAGFAYEKSPECKHWDYPIGVTAGLVSGLEAGMGFGGQLEERTEKLEESGPKQSTHAHGIGDLAIGAKWQVIGECPFGARHALAPSVKFPTADAEQELGSGETDYDVTWISSRSIGRKAGVHLNVGYSWIGGQDDNVLHYGGALDFQIVATVQWVGEIFAEKALAGDSETDFQYNTGFRWNLADGLTLDIAAGSKISGDTPDFSIKAGLTWAFGFNDKDNK